MATKNDVTGDSIQSRAASEAYSNNYDAIFGKKKVNQNAEPSCSQGSCVPACNKVEPVCDKRV